ncbi:hypothetical protein KP509_06G049800 [Ceratopteris richardii]|uniref:CASP-like protein n=1 Tax=Ceratopteris richardii TaxID=49495 RepID=A0A8T2UP04_CERRI|nr:hypothetical protein KP509_06G049800 [Ceratopteris richardii]
MENNSTDRKMAPDRSQSGESNQEPTASAARPSVEETEIPPLEEASEPQSNASTPVLSSIRSEDLEKGFSPISPYTDKSSSPFSFYGPVLSPTGQSQGRPSSSSYLEEDDRLSLHLQDIHSQSSQAEDQASDTDDQTNIGQQRKKIIPEIDLPPLLGSTNHKEGIGSNRKDVYKDEVVSKTSWWAQVHSSAKDLGFKNKSLVSRSSAAVPDMKRWQKVTAYHMMVIEVGLRIAGAILALVTFSVMCAASEWRRGAGSTFKMSFSDYQAYNYLVGVNIISFLYSCGRSFRTWQPEEDDFVISIRKEKTIVYACDQVLAFLLLSASTAAATAAQLSRHGLHNIWPPACETWSLWHFCTKADAAVVISFFSSLSVISSSIFSGYRISSSLPE